MCVTITAIFSFPLLLVGKGEGRKCSVSNSIVKQPSLATGRWFPFRVRPVWISRYTELPWKNRWGKANGRSSEER